jgi:hypothetical protein
VEVGGEKGIPANRSGGVLQVVIKASSGRGDDHVGDGTLEVISSFPRLVNHDIGLAFDQ